MYEYYKQKDNFEGPTPREFAKMTEIKYQEVLKGREQNERKILLENENSQPQDNVQNTIEQDMLTWQQQLDMELQQIMEITPTEERQGQNNEDDWLTINIDDQ